MVWTDQKTSKKYEYTWGYDHVKTPCLSKILKENTKANSYITSLARYGAEAEIKIGGATFPVRINEITQNYEELSFECTALQPYAPNITTKSNPRNPVPSIKDVIFNDPATIVFWSDNTKTVVKCGEGDIYDPEKGLAMAIAKRALGNEGNYYETFKKWVNRYVPKIEIPKLTLGNFMVMPTNTGYSLSFIGTPKEEPVVEKKHKWVICYEYHGDDFERVLTGTYKHEYSTKYTAERAARRMYGDPVIGKFKWTVKEI